TQGGYSFTQYSGMIVPFGSSTRSTRTVYQGFFARYSRVRTFQRPGSSSKWSGMGGLDDATRAREYRPHHGGGQLAGVGVLAARVVAAEQQRQAVAEARFAAVAERGARGRAAISAVRWRRQRTISSGVGLLSGGAQRTAERT